MAESRPSYSSKDSAIMEIDLFRAKVLYFKADVRNIVYAGVFVLFYILMIYCVIFYIERSVLL